MPEYLSENERAVLDSYKEEYDKCQSRSFGSMLPKLQIEGAEDIPASLQVKGYIRIKKDDLENGMEMVLVYLEDKFFEHFNIDR